MTELFELALEGFKLIVQFLVYAAIAINFFTTKGMERIHFIVVLAGYLLILHFVQDFFLSTTLITIWFVFIGVKYFVSKEILYILFIIMFFLDYSNPFFYMLAFVLYIITLSNFILSSFSKLKT